MPRKPMLICGGGIAGLTLAIRLKEQGEDPIVVEKSPEPDSGGHMIDFFGTGWDVAGRLGIADRIRSIRYPIERIEYVNDAGSPFVTIPMERLRSAFDGRFTYIRRSDLGDALRAKAADLAIPIRYGTPVTQVHQEPDGVEVTLGENDKMECEALFGADGLHSTIRSLVFGSERQLSNYLGCYIAAFEAPSGKHSIGHSIKRHEGPDTLAICYPISQHAMNAILFFRTSELGNVSRERRPSLIRERFRNHGWIAGSLLESLNDATSVYLEPMIQVKMDIWHRTRTVLLGDACACLSPLSGEDAQMGMAAGYVLASEIRKSPGDLRSAFERYEDFIQPKIAKRQVALALRAESLVPQKDANFAIRRLGLRIRHAGPFLRNSLGAGGAQSLIRDYA